MEAACEICCDARPTRACARAACGARWCAPCADRCAVEDAEAGREPRCPRCRWTFTPRQLRSLLSRPAARAVREARRRSLVARERPLLRQAAAVIRGERRAVERRIAACRRRAHCEHLRERVLWLRRAAVAEPRGSVRRAELEACGARLAAEVREVASGRLDAAFLPPEEPEPHPRAGAACGAPGCAGAAGVDGRCAACGASECPACRAPVALGGEAAHACAEADAESARLVAREARPCPGCAAPSEKVDGCDQVWCAACHTLFLWSTMRVDDSGGRNHTYDYARYRRDARVPGDVPCGGIPARSEIAARAAPAGPHPVLVRAAALCTAVNRAIARVGFPGHDPAATSALRVRLVRGDIDEARFAAALEARARVRERAREVVDGLANLVCSAACVLQRYCAGEIAEGAAAAAELEGLRRAWNEGMRDAARERLVRAPPSVGPAWVSLDRWQVGPLRGVAWLVPAVLA